MRTRSGQVARATRTVTGAVTMAGCLTVALATPAVASTPLRGWEKGSDMSLASALVVFVGGPLAIVVAITLLVLAPSVAGRSRQQGSRSWWGEPQWFGGETRAGSVQKPELPATPGTVGTDGFEIAAGGGASARW